MEDYSERIKEQRSRKKIVAAFHDAHATTGTELGHKYLLEDGERAELSAGLQLEVLMDVRDILLDMREWLPTRE